MEFHDALYHQLGNGQVVERFNIRLSYNTHEEMQLYFAWIIDS